MLHSRHDRERGEVVGKILFPEGQVLRDADALTRNDLHNSVHQMEAHVLNPGGI